jgi:hypothetical protein
MSGLGIALGPEARAGGHYLAPRVVRDLFLFLPQLWIVNISYQLRIISSSLPGT